MQIHNVVFCIGARERNPSHDGDLNLLNCISRYIFAGCDAGTVTLEDYKIYSGINGDIFQSKSIFSIESYNMEKNVQNILNRFFISPGKNLKHPLKNFWISRRYVS